MEYYKERRKKSDKAKEKYEKNGAHSAKHVRLIEQITSNKYSVPITKPRLVNS